MIVTVPVRLPQGLDKLVTSKRKSRTDQIHEILMGRSILKLAPDFGFFIIKFIIRDKVETRTQYLEAINHVM